MPNKEQQEAEAQLDRMNTALRENPEYQKFLQSLGVKTDVAEGQAWRLTDEQRKKAEDWVEARTGPLGKRLEIDISGNVNQNEGMAKQVRKWGPIVAAGVATALTAGASAPLLATAIGAGAAGAAAGSLDEGGWKGALQGGAMGVGGAVGGAYLGSALRGGTAVAPGAVGGGGNTAGAAFDAAPAISSSAGAANAAGLGWTVPGGTSAALGAAPAAAGGTGLWGSVLKGAGGYEGLANIGAGAASGYAKSKAGQREAEANTARDQEYLRQTAERNYFDTLLAGEQEKRVSGNDAWKRLLNADYIGNYKPAGLNLSPYSRQIQGPGAEMRAAATDPMMIELLKRRTSGQYDPYGGATPIRTPDFSRWDKALKPGIWEDILGYGGAALSAYGSRRPQTA